MTIDAAEIAEPSEEQKAQWLDEAIYGLQRAEPDVSASSVLSKPQKVVFIAGGLLLVLCAVLWPINTAITVLVTVNFIYAIMVSYRVRLASARIRPSNHRSSSAGALLRISDEEALAIPDDELPIYTVLLPAYQEPGIVTELLQGVGLLNYPREKLDVLLLLEEDDDLTINAVKASAVQEFARLVPVPAAEPRTKPKACNYGLFLARGEIVTIYDAEDVPDPLQLRRAVAAFRESPPNTACIQARLSYRNATQNLLTRWFAIEYDAWFGFLLPGLAQRGGPVPLGGTSNHLRLDVLQELHGWDAFNVTEDADLGIRLAKAGYRCGVLDSVTWEEANSDLINWTRQRSRWNKGYMQTALIHLRHPVRLWRQIGTRRMVNFMLTVPATPILSLLNPIAWVMSLAWWMGNPVAIAHIFPPILIYLSFGNIFFGNFAAIYIDVLAVRELNRTHLMSACFLMPLYWVVMAAGTVKAFVQLITAPSYWEKTAHGLDQPT